MSEAKHETIVPPSADGRTAADGGPDDCSTESDATSDDGATAAYTDPNFPPESFWLSKDAEYDWFDRHAVYERGESTKVYSNSTNLHSILHPHSNPSSQRFSGHSISKAAILGLPKTQKITYNMDSKRMTCNKTGSTSLFPKKRTVCPERTAVQLAEPGSPKVSCMGRVRSKRGRRRSNSSKRMEKSRSGRDQSQNQNQNHKQKQKQKKGFYSKVMSMFRWKKGHRKVSGSRKAAEVYAAEPAAAAKWMSRSLSAREVPVCGETGFEPPGLGGVKRFASGRRSDFWTT